MRREMKRRRIQGWPGRRAHEARKSERYLRDMLAFYRDLYEH